LTPPPPPPPPPPKPPSPKKPNTPTAFLPLPNLLTHHPPPPPHNTPPPPPLHPPTTNPPPPPVPPPPPPPPCGKVKTFFILLQLASCPSLSSSKSYPRPTLFLVREVFFPFVACPTLMQRLFSLLFNRRNYSPPLGLLLFSKGERTSDPPSLVLLHRVKLPLFLRQ